MAERRFTPAEVNLLIPELEGIIRSIRTLEGEIQEKEWRLKQAKVEARRAGQLVDDTFLREETEIEFLRIVNQGNFERVRDLGGEVKGGYLVDFPGTIRGQDVLLCWKPGERSVGFYHGLYEGMLGRKPIPEDLTDEAGEG
ncbi:MAG TPA: DUF2203 domain-containing protein [Symbiobacteriaceae bacterium]|nr:DUF2203 domain-containing protein [Symbiobacteriaceae bacterium]